MDNIITENIGSSRNATSVMVISCGAFSTVPGQTDVSESSLIENREQPTLLLLLIKRMSLPIFMPIFQCRGGAAKCGLISITYHKYILGVHKYILRLEISTFDRENH